MLLTESVDDIQELIFDNPELTATAKIYKAIKDYECSLSNNVKKERLMAKFFKSQNIAPQVKQQAIRKYEEELRSNV